MSKRRSREMELYFISEIYTTIEDSQRCTALLIGYHKPDISHISFIHQTSWLTHVLYVCQRYKPLSRQSHETVWPSMYFWMRKQSPKKSHSVAKKLLYNASGYSFACEITKLPYMIRIVTITTCRNITVSTCITICMLCHWKRTICQAVVRYHITVYINQNIALHRGKLTVSTIQQPCATHCFKFGNWIHQK